jgi:AraC family transcriptional regulator, regulatory protein of adaptative response / DNA-3-methyladenine glycosylase II
MLERDACYRALRTRDARFDGRFFTCVKTTGIFCRPVCPARTPRLENCVFLPSAAAAQEAGFRPCLRCRPEASPDLAVWRGTSNTVARALALIGEGALDGEGDVGALAERLGVGERQLRRLFRRHLGASPNAVSQTRRVLFAKSLLDETHLPITQVALASGFGSVRRFNETMRRAYRRSPRELRRVRAPQSAAGAEGIGVRLPFRAPYDWDGVLGFLAARAIPGVELVADGAYRRTVALGGARGTVEVRCAGDHLRATIALDDVAQLPRVVARLRRVFDVGADPAAIAAQLSADPRLAPLVAARPGLRVPGAFDGFELAVRAILGQQITVRAATALAGTLVAAHGEPFEGGAAAPELRFLFPAAERIAALEATGVGMPRARAASLAALARAVIADPRFFEPAADLDAAILRLRAVPGIGEWTAQYVAMRALGEPDAFPTPDVALLRAMEVRGARPTPKALLAAAEAWRPWRAYAALHLWASLAPRTENACTSTPKRSAASTIRAVSSSSRTSGTRRARLSSSR